MAFEKVPYIGSLLLTVGLVTFAFSTILGWSYYGERALEYLGGNKFVWPYRILFIIAVFFGAVMNLSFVWNVADLMNAFMALPNILSLLFLSGILVSETRKYLWNDRLDDSVDENDL